MRLGHWMRRVAALLLAAPLLACLFSCRAAGDPARHRALTVCLGARPASLDPQRAFEQWETRVFARHLFEGLTRPNFDGSGWTGGVAEDYALSPDGRTATFFLRTDAVWSDGLPVVAEDFVYAWNRLFCPECDLPYVQEAAEWLSGAQERLDGAEGAALGVRAVDEKTLKVELTAPCPYLEALMALPILAPLRRDQVEGGGLFGETEGALTTNGAYCLRAEKAEGTIALARSKTYWDRASVRAESICFSFLSQEEAARETRAGRLAVSLVFPEGEQEALAAEGLLAEAVGTGSWYVEFNTERAPFDDPRVRQAFALALDAPAAAKAMQGKSAVAADALISPLMRDARTGEAFYAPGRYALVPEGERGEAARRALRQAGYPDGAGLGSVEFLVDQSDEESGLARALCEQWRAALGVEVRLVVADRLETVRRRWEGEFQMARATFANALGDPLYTLDAEITMAAYEEASEEYAALASRARSARDAQARREALMGAERFLMENAVYAPVLFYGQRWIQAPGLRGAAFAPGGEMLLFGARWEGDFA